MLDLAQRAIQTEEALRAERTAVEVLWEEAYNFTMPTKATFRVTLSEGVTRDADLLDSTGARSLEQFAAYLFSTLNNPASQWIGVKVYGVDKAFLARADVQQAQEQIAADVKDFLATEARLYETLHEAYIDLGAVGNGTAGMELTETRLHASSPHPYDIVFDLDEFNLPGAHFVQHQWFPEQIAAKFGIEALYGPEESIGDDESQRQRRANRDKVRLLEVNLPRNPDKYSLSTLLPKDVQGDGWTVFWVNCKTKKIIGKFTMERTPKYATGRWFCAPGTKTGRGPGITALPDMRMANRMSATITRAGEKLVDPPWAVFNGSLLSPLRLFSGGITHVEGDRPPTPLLAAGSSRVDISDALLEQRQQAIREAFFTPLFLNPQSPVRSATEILQQVDERNRAVGPMLIRVQEELIRRVVARAIDLGDVAGAFSTVPPVLDGKRLRLEYNSPLTASQAQMEALGTSRLFELLAPWAQFDASVIDPFDLDRIGEVAQMGSGAPASIRRNLRDVQALRKARAEQQKAMAAMQAAKEVGIPAANVAAQSKRT